jgi:serine/threonine-protein kinase
MAAIYRAEVLERNQPTGKFVAIKRILPTMALDPEVQQMFEDEARMTAMFRHPNIVGFVDYGRDGAGQYLVLEWVEGGSARDIVSSQFLPLESEAAIVLAIDVLRALSVLHRGRAEHARIARLPVIHNDVSLSNVLIDRNGDAKLADFGLARSLAHPRSRTPGTTRGKLGYIPPEVLTGSPHGVRGDLYSVGCMLWEALTGRGMFSELKPGERMRALARAERPRIRSVRPDLAPNVAALIDGATAFDPHDRPASADIFAEALTAAVSSEAVQYGRECVIRRLAGLQSSVHHEETKRLSVGDPEVAALLASTMRAIGETDGTAFHFANG